MRKSLTALAAVATVAVGAIATPTTADARWGWWGPAVLGGFAAGAIIGSAFARPYYGYGYGYGYPAYGYGGYYAPAYYGGYYPAYSGYSYALRPYYSCWRWRGGYRYRVC